MHRDILFEPFSCISFWYFMVWLNSLSIIKNDFGFIWDLLCISIDIRYHLIVISDGYRNNIENSINSHFIVLIKLLLSTHQDIIWNGLGLDVMAETSQP